MSSAYPFLLAAPRHDPNRRPPVALPRDSEANSQLLIALNQQGVDFGKTILNYPPTKRCYQLLDDHELLHVEVPFVKAEDLLCCTTRLPLSDGWHDDNKKVEPSNTTLERLILLHFWRYFEICARSFVVLTDSAAQFLPPGKRDRQHLSFYQIGCGYRSLQEAGRSRREISRKGAVRTAAFLLRSDEIWPGGPGLVLAFGQNAVSTLAFCRALRFNHSHLLEKRGLTMVELTPTEEPERPVTFDWTEDWGFEVLFSTEVELPRRSDEANFPPRF